MKTPDSAAELIKSLGGDPGLYELSAAERELHAAHKVTAIPPVKMHLVRSTAGVFVGHIVHRDGAEVTMTLCSNIWRWRGANTLCEMAVAGVDRKEYTRISDRAPCVEVVDAAQILEVGPGVDLSPVWNS